MTSTHGIEHPENRNKSKQDSLAFRLNYGLRLRKLLAIDVSNLTGFSKSTISLYMNGKSEPGKERLLKLAAALRVDPAWLYGLTPLEAYRPNPYLDSDLTRIQNIYNSLNEEGRKHLINTANILFENSTFVSDGLDN